jgi:drug/metabolite transporter (DMT)-like permease
MTRSRANALLLGAAFIWGTTFVAQSLGMAAVGPFTFTAVRFLIGSLIIVPLAVREYRRLQRSGIVLTRRDLASWCGLGVVLFLGVNCQQIGLMTTTVSNAGFLTALYVPLVPMLSWLLYRERLHPMVWPAVAGSLVGTFLLSGGQFSALTVGDYWVLLSTVFWGFHVLWVGRFAARKGAPVLVALTQFVVCGVLSLVPMFTQETVTSSGLWQAMPAILYGGVLSVGIAYTLQVVAQSHSRPADAAILLSSELLFAAIAGALCLGEKLSSIQLAGGILIFACILAVQLLPAQPLKPAEA